MMDLESHWNEIKAAFESSIKSGLHCAIATVGADGYPHVTPIGFIFLRDDYTAFYSEEYTKKIPQNVQHNPRVCLLLVNSGRLFWATSLYRGRFTTSPGIRLIGVAGERRVASAEERSAYLARVKPFRKLKGYSLIWRDLNYVREIKLLASSPWCTRG